MKHTLPLLLLALGAHTAHAAVISWGSATALSTTAGNSSQVSTTGTVHHAINGLQVSATAEDPLVNGTTFSYVKGGGNGTSPVGNLWIAGSTGDTTYNTLLSSANFGLGGPSVTISLGDGSTLGGAAFVIGQEYEIQIWYVDDRASQDARVMTFGDGLGNNVNLNDQFAIGTFTANGTTQDLSAVANGFGQAHINALQVRAVPEPSSAVLISLGGIALILHRRK